MPRPYQLRKVAMLGGLCLLALSVLLLQQKHQLIGQPPDHIFNHPYFNYTLEEPDTEEDQFCHFVQVHPFHPSVWKHFGPPKEVTCNARQPDLVYLDRDGYLRFNVSEVIGSGYGPPDVPSVECSFVPVLRKEGTDDAYYYGPPKVLKVSGTYVDQDFILVTCNTKTIFELLTKEVYSAFHVQARYLISKDTIATKHTITIKESISDNFINSQKTKQYFPPKAKAVSVKVPTNYLDSKTPNSAGGQIKDHLNVVILGVDSLSRLAFMRYLPLTYQFLTKSMGAVVFRGMNKVADNTFPNLGAILTGQAVYGGLLHPPQIEHYDDWPLVWKEYKSLGYVTHFAEDLPEYNMFTYLSTGFAKQPTDYYLRPFWLAVQDSQQLRSSSHLCLGSKQRFIYQLEYFLSFLRRHRNKPHFAFSFLAEFSHDYLSRTSSADQGFRDALETMSREGLLNQTLFVFLSDHGHRFDPFRQTPMGRLEERTPFFSMVLPSSLSHLRDVVNVNSGRLTSPYDLHATLMDVYLNVSSNSQLGTRVEKYGRTMFGSIPAERTCGQAGIPDFYCACGLDIQEMSLDSVEDHNTSQEAGSAVVKAVNGLLDQSSDLCAKLEFNKVKSMQRLNLNRSNSTNTTSLDEVLVVMVEVKPSYALLEANVRHTKGAFVVEGDVSRVNKYRGQSDCIQNAVLRKYCYCKS